MNNDLEQFSEERLIELSRFKQASELAALARIALAVKQSKPVAWILNNGPSGASHIERDGRIADLFGIFNGNTVRPLYTTPQPAHTEQDGWKLVPIEPTEGMVINGFESEPDKSFTPDIDWEAYDAMSGCEQAAHRAKLCWQAMLRAAPKPESE